MSLTATIQNMMESRFVDWWEAFKGDEWDLLGRHTMEEYNQQLETWQYTCNYLKPHQAFDYLTPAEYHELWIQSQKTKHH